MAFNFYIRADQLAYIYRMMSKTEIFVLVLVTMTTLTHQQATENVAPTSMDLPQAQQMFVQTFLDMDLNHDHLVGLREFMDPFLKHDHDHNMAVSLTEFLQHAPAEENREYRASVFRFHDENHDDVITVPEMQLQFSTIDTDDVKVSINNNGTSVIDVNMSMTKH